MEHPLLRFMQGACFVTAALCRPPGPSPGRRAGSLQDDVVTAQLSVRVASGRGAEPGQSYILHKPCPSLEGLGSSLAFLKPIIAAARLLNLTYVCQAKDFRTKDHSTGYMGNIFGCYNDSFVVGDMVAYNQVKAQKGLSWQNARISLVDALLYAPGKVTNFFENFTPMEVRPDHVYFVDQPGLMFQKWNHTYRWFRSQYHLVRNMDPDRREPKCWNETQRRLAGNKTIVVAIRRGDGRMKSPVKVYTHVLDKLLAGKFDSLNVELNKTNIVVIAETKWSNPEFKLFSKYDKSSVTYLLGEPEQHESTAPARLVRDLDCMSLADVLILSRGGFSALAAALQLDGVSLAFNHQQQDDLALPNVDKSFQDLDAAGISYQRSTPTDRDSFVSEIMPDELPNSFVVNVK